MKKTILKIGVVASLAFAVASVFAGFSTNSAHAVDTSCGSGQTLRAERRGGVGSTTTYKSPCRTTRCRWVGQTTLKYAPLTNPFDPLQLLYKYEAVAGDTPSNFCSGDVNGGTWR